MSEANEDTPISSLHKHQSADDDPSDDIQDFRFLGALTSNSKLPKRGEKDFEPHGTNHQNDILEASRQAMHDALNQPRVHAAKNHVKAYYYGEGVGDTEEFKDALDEENRGAGLGEDHVVMVEDSRGVMYRNMGKHARGNLEAKGKTARLWLLPEEALYLVERGNLDLRWPGRPSDTSVLLGDDASEDEELLEFEDGIPMSLQATYAVLIGSGTQKWKIDIDRYTVYDNLRRAGYAVLRAPEWDPSSTSGDRGFVKYPHSQQQSTFSWLWGQVFSEKTVKHLPDGPLVQPGLYRSYNSIFRLLSIAPPHKPQDHSEAPPYPPEPFRVVFHAWKPANGQDFKKSNPGLPDFRIAVVSARDTSVPTMTEMIRLLESTPYSPPPKGMDGPSKSYARIKHGYRNVILAVVDQGIISYMRMSESAFGEEKPFERKAAVRGGKGGGRGGFRGRGRGRGRR